jgi:hypothetical protein
MSTRYWLSWYDESFDYRPVKYPPNEAILGWWCTGLDHRDRATICALVQASSEHEAWAAVAKDWPQSSEHRFIEDRGPDYVITSDRFPRTAAWMISRMKKEAQP